MKKILALFLLSMASVGSAHALIYVNALGGGTFTNDAFSPSASGSAKLGLTYGATAEIDFTPFTSIEAGILSVGNKTSFGGTTQSYRTAEVPVLLRFTALPLLDFGGGLYFASYPSSFPNSKSDFGLRVSTRLKTPLAPLIHFLIDVNYDYGMKDLDPSAGSEKHRAFGVLTGLAIGF